MVLLKKSLMKELCQSVVDEVSSPLKSAKSQTIHASYICKANII